MLFKYFGADNPIQKAFFGGGLDTSSLELVSASSTALVYRNTDTDTTTTFHGTGLVLPGVRFVNGFPIPILPAGTVTGWTSTMPRLLPPILTADEGPQTALAGPIILPLRRTIAQVSEGDWHLREILPLLETTTHQERKTLLTALFNQEPAITIDASASTGPGMSDMLGTLTSPLTYLGSGRAENVLGSTKNDWITPAGGDDTIAGGAGSDMVSFNDLGARVEVDLATGTATSGASDMRLSGVERVTGTSHGDLIIGNSANNLLRGMGDYDWMVGSGGADTFDGGTGRDTVAYTSAISGITANLTTGKGTAGQANGDSYIAIEALSGSSHADRLTGNGVANALRGLGGDDFLYGGSGNDTLDGGAGRDALYGGIGNDQITGGRGNDVLAGGAGYDTALYSGTRVQYTISTREGVTTVTHRAGGVDGVDVLTGIEALSFSNGDYFL